MWWSADRNERMISKSRRSRVFLAPRVGSGLRLGVELGQRAYRAYLFYPHQESLPVAHELKANSLPPQRSARRLDRHLSAPRTDHDVDDIGQIYYII